MQLPATMQPGAKRKALYEDRLGVLRRVDFAELGADLLAVYRYDFQAREA
jgi:hypothetical protein